MSGKLAMPVSTNARHRKRPAKALIAITADEKMQATIKYFEEAQIDHFIAYVCQLRGLDKEELCWD
ncbi:MAG: hypothetical protein ABI145_13495 [Steroidobacteraceae bacterium]